MKPMLSGKLSGQPRFPVLASPKLDGIRALVVNGELVTRNFLRVPNDEIYMRYARPELHGLDGELICGPATAIDCYRRTSSAVMSKSSPDSASVMFRVFDDFTRPSDPFKVRMDSVENRVDMLYRSDISFVAHVMISSHEQLDEYEAECLAAGYEGVMLRDPAGPYKYGRSTEREGWLLKMKRFEDAEARVVGLEELQHNHNEKERDALGRVKRSTSKALLVASGTLGALVVEGVNGPYAGVRFNIGTGFDQRQRDELWAAGASVIGRTVTYRYFPSGSKDRPRFPVFVGFRMDL